MKKINLGRVMPVFRGTYDAEQIYTKLDIVYYDGSSYVARRTVTGTAPTDTENWLLVARAGGVSWVDLTEQQKTEIYNTIIGEIFGVQGDRLTLKHNGNTVTFHDDGNITTATHNLDTMQQAIESNASAIEGKADSSDVYSKQQIDQQRATLQSSIDTKAAANTVYTKQEINSTVDQINTAVSGKANASSVYNKDAVDIKVGNVASAVSTLSSNVYTKAQINSAVNELSDGINTLQNTTYTRQYLDNQLGGKADVENIYTKNQVDFMLIDKIVTPDYYADFATLIRSALYNIRAVCGLDPNFYPQDNTTQVDASTLTVSIPNADPRDHIYNCTNPLTSLTLESVEASRFTTTIYFKSGSTATTFTYPNTLKWLSSDTIAANTNYVLSIHYNRAELKAEQTN